ncbi:MAG: hypothetical protein HKM04_08445 [Legionellales bacterium]|nr:hypothetical protein [Legionellales bacterium]
MTKILNGDSTKDNSLERIEVVDVKSINLIFNNNKQAHSPASIEVQSQTPDKNINNKLIYSERLPFISLIPIDKKNNLKLLSWKLPATENQANKAQIDDELAYELDLIANTVTPDVILLQELNLQPGENAEGLFAKIQKKLGKNYHVVLDSQGKKVATSNKTITFYSKKIFDSQAKREGEGENPVFGDEGYDLLKLKTGQQQYIGIKNANAKSSRTPLAHETEIKDFLNKGKQNGRVHIVAGNLNCPASKSLSHNTKTKFMYGKTANSALNEKYGQAHFHTEGAFYFNLADNKCCQARVNPLNPATKKPFNTEELANFIKINAKPINDNPPQLAATMLIDDESEFQKNIKVGNGKFLSTNELEVLFRNKSKAISLSFRCATDFCDSQGISALGLSENIYLALRTLFPEPEFHYEVVDSIDLQEVFIVHAPEARSLQLIKALQAIQLIEQLCIHKQRNSKLITPLETLIKEVSRDESISHEQAELFYKKCLDFLNSKEKESSESPNKLQINNHLIQEIRIEILAKNEEIRIEPHEEIRVEQNEEIRIEPDEEIRTEPNDEIHIEQEQLIFIEKNEKTLQNFTIKVKTENASWNGLKFLKAKALASFELKEKLDKFYISKLKNKISKYEEHKAQALIHVKLLEPGKAFYAEIINEITPFVEAHAIDVQSIAELRKKLDEFWISELDKILYECEMSINLLGTELVSRKEFSRIKDEISKELDRYSKNNTIDLEKIIGLRKKLDKCRLETRNNDQEKALIRLKDFYIYFIDETCRYKELAQDQDFYNNIIDEINRYFEDDTIDLPKTFKYYDHLAVLVDAKKDRKILPINNVPAGDRQLTDQNIQFFHVLFPKIYADFEKKGAKQDQIFASSSPLLITPQKAANALPLINRLLAISDKPDIVGAISNLITTVTNDNDISSEQALVVYNHFVEPLDAIKEGRLVDQKKIAASGKALDKILHHSSTTDIATKIAIRGALGAVAGFVVGCVIGSFVTMGFGGFAGGGVGAMIGIVLFGGDTAIAGGAMLAWRQHKKVVKNKDISEGYRGAYNTASHVIRSVPNLFKPSKLQENQSESAQKPDRKHPTVKRDDVAEGAVNRI